MRLLRRQKPTVDAPAFSIRSTVRTHLGKVRALNEDRFFACPERKLWAVADGMGGHSAGDLAASLAIQSLVDLTASDAPITLQRLSEALVKANGDILSEMKSRAVTGGSTLACFWIDEGGEGHCLWLGDSRIYRARQACFDQLTHDHSVVQQLVDRGLIDQAAAANHPQASVLTRALGVCADAKPDHLAVDLHGGDAILLCTDGLTGELTNPAMKAYIGDDINASSSSMLASALGGQARDNITFILVSLN